MIVTPVWRKALAFLSACGVAASVLSYIGSFLGAPVDRISQWGLLLIPGAVALIVPIHALEYPASRAPSFSWKGFARGMPRWVSLCANLLSLLFIAHLIWFALQSGAGVPAIVDGEYVLDSRGRILKVLTQPEYLTLKAAELRVFATLIISVYFVPMTYWWFWRNHQYAALNL